MARSGSIEQEENEMTTATPITGELETEDDDGRVRVYVEHDTLGRGLVFLNLDYATDEDDANVEADFAEKGFSDRGGTFIPVPFDSGKARELAAALFEAADLADEGRRGTE
jgi:hypothetical protein